MLNRIHQVGEAIDFNYAVAGDPGTAAPVVDVIDESGAVVATLGVGTGLTQSIPVGTEQIFSGSFTPATEGGFKIHCRDANGGKRVKTFLVGLRGIKFIIDTLLTTDGKVDTALSEIANNGAAITIVDGKVDAALTGIATNLAALTVIDGKVDSVGVSLTSIETKIDGLAGGGAHVG